MHIFSPIVSPPNEHITGDEWWKDYQPVSYKIESRRGNREQFRQMVTKCHTAGVKVITGESSFFVL